jgi:GntR family transcriptional regulator/MocR family aminotransferase
MEIHISLVDRPNLSAEIYRHCGNDPRWPPAIRRSSPPMRELARAVKVSRSTFSVAYERLLGEGFVTARVGAGIFVSKHVSPLEDPLAGSSVHCGLDRC